MSAAMTIYYTPYMGRYVPVYNGTIFTMSDVLAELSQTTTDTTKSPAACAANSNYDLFVWLDGGTFRCTRGPLWTSDTARGTGAGTTELQLVNGVYLNKNAITNGPSANRGTYVGTIRTNGSSQVDYNLGGSASGGSAAFLGVWNMYNRCMAIAQSSDSGASYTYASATIRQQRGSTGMKISYIAGLSEDAINATYGNVCTVATNGQASIAIGFDTITAFSGALATSNASLFAIGTFVSYGALSGLGVHYVSGLERSDLQTTTFYPASASTLSLFLNN